MDKKPDDSAPIAMIDHLLIKDGQTGEVLVNVRNTTKNPEHPEAF